MSLFLLNGDRDQAGCEWSIGAAHEANALLANHHYLGPLAAGARLTVVGEIDGDTVAAMMWRLPTSRALPADGSWLELSRWCLTAAAGTNAGSRMHRAAVRIIRRQLPGVTTLVSYSDPRHGHTGALYRACNWQWAPTWHRLRPPPTGNGDWGTGPQSVKDRWVFAVRPDPIRASTLAVDDLAAIRHWQRHAPDFERRWAAASEHVQFSEVVPSDERAVDRNSLATHAGDDSVHAIRAYMPSNEPFQHHPGVCLIPRQFHGAKPSRVGAR